MGNPNELPPRRRVKLDLLQLAGYFSRLAASGKLDCLQDGHPRLRPMSARWRLLPLLGRAAGPVRPRHFTVSSRLSARQHMPTRPYKPPQHRRHQDQPPPQHAATEALANKHRAFALVGAGIVAAVAGAYLVMVVMSITSGAQACHVDDCNPSGRPLDLRQGKVSAAAFDRDLNASENLIGVKGLRELMGGLARGHVLEVAVGTGRNIDYIDWDEIRATAPPIATDADTAVREVKSEQQLAKERRMRRLEKHKKGMALPGDEAPEVLSYTGVDVSTDVLEVAWLKLKKSLPDLVPRRKRQSKEEGGAQQPVQQQQEKRQSETAKSWLGKAAAAVLPTSSTPSSPLDEEDMTLAANLGQGRIRLYKSDAQTRLPPPPARSSHDGTKTLPAPAYYDTILQNFGLCSVSDPQQLLANMATLLQPGSGRIYLLEHGRGWYSWLNGLLDKFAPAHFKKYGCWWNRDIEAIVRQAEEKVPGLEVVRIERPLLLLFGTTLWVELRVNPDKKT